VRRARLRFTPSRTPSNEGKNLFIERRYAGGRVELLQPFAAELVRLKVEIIVTNGTDAALAAKEATTRIPIVMYSAGDPVGAGLVASLSRRGGNVTGFSTITTELRVKRLEVSTEPNRDLGHLDSTDDGEPDLHAFDGLLLLQPAFL
jgi:hypothetical protein